MTGPKDPEGEDWGFPEVDPAGPASVLLPDPEPEPEDVYDTGSDAWWRAQAQAQRRATESDPLVPLVKPPAPAPVAPPELVEPQVLRPEPAPNPLDSAWLPPDLPDVTDLHATAEIPIAPPPAPPAATSPPAPPAAPSPIAPPASPNPPIVARPPLPRVAAALPEPPVEGPAVPSLADGPVEGMAPPPDPVPATRTPHEGTRPGPTRAVAGAALAVAGVALGIGALLLLGKDEPKGTPTVQTLPSPSHSAPSTVSTAPSVVSTVRPTTPVVVVPPSTAAATSTVAPVSVLNNSRIKGLASQAAARFRAGGWPVPRTGNYSGGIISTTTVYYAPGQLASAQQFASRFGISRVAPRFRGLPGSGLTVVLTRDYA
ncbi:MAG: hypothetical protein JWM02_2829 [Frankiales bacterium]|nr:hypothetical protein [Frankiales bacterium]